MLQQSRDAFERQGNPEAISSTGGPRKSLPMERVAPFSGREKRPFLRAYTRAFTRSGGNAARAAVVAHQAVLEGHARRYGGTGRPVLRCAPPPVEGRSRPRRVFLLSPALLTGRRAELLLRPDARSALAERLRSGGGAPLGEIFAFVSGLYFRGKLAYARAFGSPPAGLPPALVITPSRGLLAAETPVGTMDLEEFRSVPMNPAEPAYRLPLETSARTLTQAAPDCDVILLGSIATAKYVEVLQSAFGERLLFPVEFLGRGDMSRGSLMLRAAEQGNELAYAGASNLPQRGMRG